MSTPAADTTRQCRFCLKTAQQLANHHAPYMKADSQVFAYAVLPTGDCCTSCLLTLGHVAFMQQEIARNGKDLANECAACQRTFAELQRELNNAAEHLLTKPITLPAMYAPGLCMECCVDLGIEEWNNTKRKFATAIAAADRLHATLINTKG